jgi:hypothetical protein
MKLNKINSKVMSIAKPIQIRPENGYKLFIKFSDGKEGIVDLSNLVGKGVFSVWNDQELFKQAYIDVTGAIAWNNDLDICSDALYDKIKN